MVKPEIVRQWKREKTARIVTRVIEKAIEDFSKSGRGQVNLAAKSARHSLTRRVVTELQEADLIKGIGS